MGSFPPENRILTNFDVDLHKFYFDTLIKELDITKKKIARDVKFALKEVVKAYKRNTDDDIAKSLRFDSSAKRCAYVLKHSACFTSAVARHFLGLAIASQQLFAINLDEVNLCCLGGGPASDAVGFSRILGAIQSNTWARKHLTLKVTVVDVNEDWELTAGHVLETLKDATWMKGIKLSFSFCRADLTRPFEEDVKAVLKAADFVTMVYFLSAVNHGKNTIESYRMVKEIMTCMRDDATLFFLDSAMDVNYKQMNNAANSVGVLAQIYGPHIEEFHCLSIDSVRTFLELYKKDFGRFLCLTNCFVSSSAWRKNETSSFQTEYNRHIATVSKTSETDDRNDFASVSIWLLNNDFSSKTLRDELSNLHKSLALKISKHKILAEEITSNCRQDGHLPLYLFSENSDNLPLSSAYGSRYSLKGKILMDKYSFYIHEESLTWRCDERPTASCLTAKMLGFRSQIDCLLAAEFEELPIEEIDEIDNSFEDAFDNLFIEYIYSVPKYFFQTKSKKKRIFTGLPLSI